MSGTASTSKAYLPFQSQGGHRARPIGGESAPERGRGDLIGATQITNVLRRHRVMIASIIAVCVALAVALIMSQTPMYRAVATLRLDTPLAGDGEERALTSTESENRVETETRTLSSHNFAVEVVRGLELLDNPAFSGRKPTQGRTRAAGKDRIDKAAAKLMSMVTVQRVPHTQLITVSVEAANPKFAAMLANRFVEIRQKEGVLQKVYQQDQIITALDERVKMAGEELRQAEQRVADFRRDNRMLVGAGGSGDLTSVNQLAAEAATAASQRAGAAARAAGVSAASANRTDGDSATSPLLAAQQQRYAELQQRQAELSTFYGPGYPSLANVEAQLAEVERNMAVEKARVQRSAAADAAAAALRETGLARSEAMGAAARAGVLSGYLNATTSKAYDNSAASVRLAELERNAETQRTLYVALAGRLKQMSTGLVTGPGLVMHSATPIPRSPFQPAPRKTLAIMLLASSILAFGAAFLAEMLDRRIRSAAQIRRLFNLESFATVPMLWTGLSKRRAAELIRTKPGSTFADAYRLLLRELLERRDGTGAHVVLITSPLPGDGKTSVAHALGAMAVAVGLKAVLVDLDLRQSTSIPGQDGAVDLVACMREPEPGQRVLSHAHETADTSLIVVAPHERVQDPNGLLTSADLTGFFSSLRERVDLVIIDAPPVLAVKDASNMASFADTTLLVVRWGRTKVDEMADSLSALKRGVDGVVLNAVDFASHAQGRYGDAVQYFRQSGAYYRDDKDMLRPSVFSKWMKGLRLRRA